MELESIYWARQRTLKTQVASHDGRISTLEDRSTMSSQTSADRWEQLKRLAEVAPKIFGLLRILYQAWPLWVALATATWTLALPGLRWLWRALSSALAYLAGLHVG